MQLTDEYRPPTLNGVASRLVQRFAAGPVAFGLVIADGAEGHFADHGAHFASLAAGQGHCCHDPVGTPGQGREHGQTIGTIDRLAKNVLIEHHAGVGAQHAALAIAQVRQSGQCLVSRDALDVGLRGFGR